MNAAEIAAALGDAERADGGNWRCRCPLCGKHLLALKDNPTGRPKLLLNSFCACDNKDIRRNLRGRKLYPNGANGEAPSEDDARRAVIEAEEAAARKQKIDSALDTWRNSLPVTDGSLGDVYLASRTLLQRSPALRYVPSVWHPKEARSYPALIGLVQHEKEGSIGVHAICLNPLDAASKLAIKDRKLSFGVVGGGAVRLFPAGPVLAIAEGIEDALTFTQNTRIPAWAAVSANGILNFVPPAVATTATLILIEDQETVGRSAVATAAKNLVQKGYAIKIARPLVGKDVNDALRHIGLDQPLCEIEDYDRTPSGGWYFKCIEGADGRTLSNLANATLALRADPAFKGLFSYDAFADVVIINRQAPRTVNQQQKYTDPEPLYPRPLTDDDISRVQEWLQLGGLATVTATTVYQSVESVAREHSFHPVRAYLASLKWDGTERLNDWLKDYLGVQKTEYSVAVGRKFLISMVARVEEPGCQCDYMVILEGLQGLEKSKALRILAGEWFSDNLPSNIASKDAKQHLRGKWLVEIPDLHVFRKSEIRELKAFQTRREDEFRPPYGRKEIYRKRQNVFSATTNEQTYLEDPTGGRRYWPLITTEIDIESLASVRDQLFAEAFVCYHRDEPWWPSRQFEATHMVPEQDARREVDAWEEPIIAYITSNLIKKTTVFQLAKDALQFDKPNIGTADQRRIVVILESLGWKRAEKRGLRGERFWEAPRSASELFK
jgi:predicted P-loop ATPase